MKSEELTQLEKNEKILKHFQEIVNVFGNKVSRYGILEKKPDFYTDWKWTKVLLDKLRDSGKYCCFNFHSNYNYVWYLSVIPSEFSDDCKHKEILTLQCDTFEELIAEAYYQLEVIKIKEFYGNMKYMYKDKNVSKNNTTR